MMYYLFTKNGKLTGGPYSTLTAMAKAICWLEAHGTSRNALRAKRHWRGERRPLTPTEAEALVAALDECS